MRKVLLLLAVLGVSACATDQPNESASHETGMRSANAVASVAIANYIPYKKGAPIAMNIKQECKINSQLSEFIQTYGKADHIAVQRVGSLKGVHHGNVLVVQIVDAISEGNAFIGHRKLTRIEGTLYENGKKTASFTGARFSGGGFFGGFKGSCSVLGRTVKALGKDVAQWLENPIDGEHMGDGV